MRTCTRRLEFDYGHRLVNHEGKCVNVHGHRGVVEVTCAAESLDDVGRVIDFGKIKALVGGWLDTQWDHGFIAQDGDPIIAWLDDANMKSYILFDPPTAENLSAYLYKIAVVLLEPDGIKVVRVKFNETPNCYAVYEGD